MQNTRVEPDERLLAAASTSRGCACEASADVDGVSGSRSSVTWKPYPPLPVGAVRDLLGITRALYRTALNEDVPDVGKLQALEDVGRTLRAALRAAHAHPGTIDYFNAWAAAERATKALGELVGGEVPLGPLIASTARCFSRPGSMA